MSHAIECLLVVGGIGLVYLFAYCSGHARGFKKGMEHVNTCKADVYMTVSVEGELNLN